MKKKAKYRVEVNDALNNKIYILDEATDRYKDLISMYDGTIQTSELSFPQDWESNKFSRPVHPKAVAFFIKDGGYHFDAEAIAGL